MKLNKKQKVLSSWAGLYFWWGSIKIFLRKYCIKPSKVLGYDHTRKEEIIMNVLNAERSAWTAREITLTAVMTAAVFLATFLPKIPSPLGYAHLGDAVIFLALCLTARREALIAALPQLLQAGDTVLVKASHSCRFEEITAAIEAM